MKYTLYTCGLVWIFEWLLNLYAEKILTDRNIQIFYEICTCSKQIWGTNLGSEQPLLFGSLWPDKCLPWGPPTCPLADQRWSRIQSPGPFRSSWRSGWSGNLTRRQRIARCPLKIKVFETFSANFNWGANVFASCFLLYVWVLFQFLLLLLAISEWKLLFAIKIQKIPGLVIFLVFLRVISALLFNSTFTITDNFELGTAFK